MIEAKRIVDVIFLTGVIDSTETFDVNKSFKDNGIDSLDVFTIFLAIEEELGIKFSEEESLQLKSAAEIINFLNTR